MQHRRPFRLSILARTNCQTRNKRLCLDAVRFTSGMEPRVTPRHLMTSGGSWSVNSKNERDSYSKGLLRLWKLQRHPQISADGAVPTDARNASEVRITTDPSAPAMSAPMVDRTHPYRQKELLQKANAKLPLEKRISTHDFLCIRRAQSIHRDLKYCYNMNWSSPRYSDACVDWLIAQVTEDDTFVHRARELYAQAKDGKRGQQGRGTDALQRAAQD
jgi:hypothetical protein